MQFDLAQVDTKTLSEAGVDMPVRNIKGEPLIARNGKPITIKLLGPDSNKYRALTRAQVRKRLTQMADGKPTLSDAEFDETERDLLDVLVACTLSWDNVLDTDGKLIAHSDDAALNLYLNYPVIREQVDGFLSSRANFLQASSQA